MDIFQRSQASSLVAFAARCMAAIGHGYLQAGADTKAFLDGEKPEGVWSLSLLLVMWYGGSLSGAEADAIARLIQTTGAARILSTLSLFRDQLLPFVQAAYTASDTSGIAAAAVYFRSALDRIGVGTVAAAVKAGAVVQVRAEASAQVPLPADVRQMYVTTQTGAKAQPTLVTEQRRAPVAGTPVARAVGVPIREGRVVPGAPGTVIKEPARAPAEVTPPPAPPSRPPPPVAPAAQPPTQPPPLSRAEKFERADLKAPPRKPPALDPGERLLAHLYVQGWSPEDIERIAKGPKA